MQVKKKRNLTVLFRTVFLLQRLNLNLPYVYYLIYRRYFLDYFLNKKKNKIKNHANLSTKEAFPCLFFCDNSLL